MAKPRSRVADYAVYIMLRCFVCVIRSLPFETACSCARGLAWLLHRLDKRHRQAALDNIRAAFPGRHSAQERERLVQAVFCHFCTLLIEIIHLPRRLHINNWRRYFSHGGDMRLLECLLSDEPLLIVTGHFGNWEIGGYALCMLGFRTHAVARPLDNPYVDDFLRGFRERTGQKLLAKKGDFEQMQAILRKGGVLATLADQDAGQRGLFVDFFGRPASTHKAVAILALEYQVPMLVLGAKKVGEPMRYQIAIGELIRPEEYAGRADAVKALTQRFTTALENVIRQAPAQYFWLHRRWKHQPGKRKDKQAA